MKKFFDVFPFLQVDDKVRQFLEETEVERVSSTKKKDLLRIYMVSGRLIEKEYIWKAEKGIEKMLSSFQTKVKIYEKYHLSSQYNTEKLMNAYRNSILLELREYSPVEYNLFKNGDISYPEEDRIVLTVGDSVPARSRGEELGRILEKICNERCGFQTSVEIAYKEERSEKNREEDELRIARQVAEISARAAEASGAETAIEGTASKKGMPEGKPGEELLAGSGTGKNAETARENEKESRNGIQSRSNPRMKKDGGKADFKRSVKRSENPDVIYGRDFEEAAIPIEDIIGEMGQVVIRGKIIKTDKREIKNEKTILFYDITDFTDTLTFKLFVNNDQVDEIGGGLAKGSFVKVKGMAVIDKFDNELTIGSIGGIKKIPDFTTSRSDNSIRKRVELHCHTKMSDMDGVSEAKDIVKRAYQWGHPAIAITDHGVVQSFPDANHVWEDLWRAEKAKRKESGEAVPDKQDFFKVIYGMEAYLVDDLHEIVTGRKNQGLDGSFVVFDIETTGFSPVHDRIIEIGAVKVEKGEIKERFSSFVNPDVPIPLEIEKLTGIHDGMVVDAPMIEEALPHFLEFCQDAVLVAHNASFDMSFIIENTHRLGLKKEFTYVDTVGIARLLLPHQAKHKLDAVAKTLGISLENHHRAVDDAEATAEIFLKFIPMLREAGADDLKAINAMGDASPDIIKRLPSYHAIILAKNDTGRVNLYRLVSESHLVYYSKRPRVPKSLFKKYREGLILGSACEAGELYRALLDEKSEEEIAKLVDFYDYLEIQPTGNNQFMIASEKIRNVNSTEDIENINRRIVELGERFNKPVVATCDVHFLDPGDEVYRRIIMAGERICRGGRTVPAVS